MEIVLPPEVQDFMQRQVSSGKYANQSALIVAALQLLRQQEDLYQGRLLELQRDALVGWNALQQGEVVDGETAISAIRHRLQEQYGHLES